MSVETIINKAGPKHRAALRDAVAGRRTKAAKGILGSPAEKTLQSIIVELGREVWSKYFPIDPATGLPIPFDASYRR